MYFTSQCQYSEQINEFHGFLSVVDHFQYEIKAQHGGFGAQKLMSRLRRGDCKGKFTFPADVMGSFKS